MRRDANAYFSLRSGQLRDLTIPINDISLEDLQNRNPLVEGERDLLHTSVSLTYATKYQ